MKIVSASDANRQFSALLQEVSHGVEVTVTAHGKPVARIIPAKAARHGREVARKRLIERLNHQSATGHRTWAREELYE